MAMKGGREKGTSPHEPKLDARLAKALNHPLRTEILAILNDRDAASPSELALILEEELCNVAYHVKTLYELDCLEIADKEQVRGTVKTRYRATTRMLLNQANWEMLSKATRTGITINALNEIIDRCSDAVRSGTMDERTDRAVITCKLNVDEESWKKIQGIIMDAYERIGEVEAASANTPPDDDETFPMTVSLLAYESPVPAAEGARS